MFSLSRIVYITDALWALGDCSTEDITTSTDVQYVLDGGDRCCITFHGSMGYHLVELRKCMQIMSAINMTVQLFVFNGYDKGASTKDQTHHRRTKDILGTKVIFTKDTPFRPKKDLFLRKSENKKNFIQVLSDTLQSRGCTCTTILVEGDADLLIVQTAVVSAKDMKTGHGLIGIALLSR